MSYELFVDGESRGQVASNNGWSEAAVVLEGAGERAALLVKYGMVQNPIRLRREIESILSLATVPVASVLRELLKMLEGVTDEESIISIGNGEVPASVTF